MSARIGSLTGKPRDQVATLIVTALSSAFGVVLLEATGVIATVVDNDAVGSSGTVRVALGAVVSVFIMIAVYVGAIVTANTFSTIISGRVRQIALLRLVGAQAGKLRRAVAVEGLVIGALGAALGLAIGIGVTTITVGAGIAQGWLPRLGYPLLDPLLLLPVAVVALTTWAAAWVGARRVSTVSPMAATGASVEPSREAAIGRRGRTIAAIVLFAFGAAALVLGVLAGLVSPLGLLIAFFGGLFSFTGIVLGAHLVMPPVLRLAGRMLGRGAPARLAAENAMRFPDRSTRATIGLVIGVTLVVMFAVAMESYRTMILDGFADDPVTAAAVDQSLTVTTAIFTGLVGFSAVIAAVGLVNNLSLSVLQRTRELGLLRALGFTARQVRATITAESAQLAIAAIGLGLLLGIGYGWVAAQSLLGSIAHQLVAPSLPWPLIGVVVVAGALLALIASLVPARRATRVSPIVALAIE